MDNRILSKNQAIKHYEFQFSYLENMLYLLADNKYVDQKYGCIFDDDERVRKELILPWTSLSPK